MIGTPFMLSTRRVGPYPPGFRDVGVALDLLTHDIDIIRYLSGSEIESVTVQATCLHSHHEEHLVAVGRLANEATVSMEAGWLSPQKIREVRVAGDAGTLVADTLLQDLYLYENSVTDGSWEALATFRGVGEGNVTKFAYPREEPLRVELREFLKAAQGKEGSIVSLDDGVAAVKLALAMRDFGGHAIPSV